MRRAALLALVALAPATLGQSQLDELAEAAFVASFAGGDPAVFLRAGNQDEVQRLCSEHRNAPPPHVAEAIERFQRASIRYPSSLSGDWQQGKRIAEDWGGLRYGDPRGEPNGGNCYACHQMTQAEVSYGTVGPSLREYGKIRKYAEADVKGVYEKIYNAHASFPCSLMPRFGSNGVLSIDQIKDLVALVMSPDSPVNK